MPKDIRVPRSHKSGAALGRKVKIYEATGRSNKNQAPHGAILGRSKRAQWQMQTQVESNAILSGEYYYHLYILYLLIID